MILECSLDGKSDLFKTDISILCLNCNEIQVIIIPTSLLFCVIFITNKMEKKHTLVAQKGLTAQLIILVKVLLCMYMYVAVCIHVAIATEHSK